MIIIFRVFGVFLWIVLELLLVNGRYYLVWKLKLEVWIHFVFI